MIYANLYKIRELIKKDYRIRHLIRRYKITHCLYMLQYMQPLFKISIPIGTIVHDIYWHTRGDVNSEEFKKSKDEELVKFLEKSRITFAASKQTEKDIVHFFPKYGPKIMTVFNAFHIHPSKSKKGIRKNLFYYPSSFYDYKNHFTLIKAVCKLANKKFKFKVIFTGMDTDKIVSNEPVSNKNNEKCRIFYQKHKKILNKYVEAQGYVTQDKVEKLYQTCSCVVLPSSFEGFGLPLAEAIARGIPVICSDIEPFKEQIELYKCEDLVTVFPAKDNKALAKCMEEFIKNPKKRLSYEEVKKRFSHWTWKEAAKKYIEELGKIRGD